MPFCHQACATRKELLVKYHFNEKYRICADYEFYVRLWKENIPRLYLQQPLAIYRIDGISNKNYLLQIEERNQIKVDYGIFTPQQAQDHFMRTQKMLAPAVIMPPATILGVLRQWIKQILPLKVRLWYQKRQIHHSLLRQGWQTYCP